MSVFGFSTEPSTGGEFLPIVKYDARAGRFFRIDRAEQNGQFVSSTIDITHNFKAMADLANIEVGWILFSPSSAPDFRLVKMGQKLPDKPAGTQHKNGLRFMVKLAKECSDAKQVREIAMTSKAALNGIEELYLTYQAEAAKHPNELPVITLSKTTPITTGSGQKSSTNYKPTFSIIGWGPRPADLIHVSKTVDAPPPQQQARPGNGAMPPATGATPAAAPSSGYNASDFG